MDSADLTGKQSRIVAPGMIQIHRRMAVEAKLGVRRQTWA